MNILTQKFEQIDIVDQDGAGHTEVVSWKNVCLEEVYQSIDPKYIKEIKLINPVIKKHESVNLNSPRLNEYTRQLESRNAQLLKDQAGLIAAIESLLENVKNKQS